MTVLPLLNVDADLLREAAALVADAAGDVDPAWLLGATPGAAGSHVVAGASRRSVGGSVGAAVGAVVAAAVAPGNATVDDLAASVTALAHNGGGWGAVAAAKDAAD
ncbi:hypothetical protein, partial [Luedemannella flava]|uniref:hypothetical protein n=1 Tax=Luedemannella flava TaxID=349316 RepID=UPI0031DDCC5C